MCLDLGAVGRTYRLYASRPGSEFNYRLDGGAPDEMSGQGLPDAAALSGAVTRVNIRGPIEQRAGYQDACGGWSDGHDAIAERLIDALTQGDVLLVVDSPGGSYAGLQEGVRRAVDAKVKHGRSVTVYADEMIGSAAYWWAACVGDKIYGPASMLVGSVGARSAHCSIAGSLEKEGVEITNFAWPPGKTALSSEQPLSEIGKTRGNRDVRSAAEAFFAAVGPPRGLTHKDIMKLDADCLSGQAAVAAKLADGVASFEDVVGYALGLAAGGGETMASEYEKTTKERYTNDGDEPEKDAEGDGEEREAEEDEEKPDAESDEPEKDAEGEDMEDDAPPSSKPAPSPPKERAASAKRLRPDASYAALVGLTEGASTPAIKAALAAQATAYRHLLSVTETRTPDRAIGALNALAEDAAKSGEYRAQFREERRRNNARERMSLLSKLSRAGLSGYARGDLFVDSVSKSGKRLGVKPAPVYAEMKLGTLRGLVDSKIKNSGSQSQKRTPYEPDPKLREHGVAHVTDADRRTSAATGHSPEAVAKSRNALFGADGAARV